jgi:dihydrofolate reductase
MLPLADRLYLTEVAALIEGDAVFPEVDQTMWREIERVEHVAGPGDEYPFAFVDYERRGPSV